MESKSTQGGCQETLQSVVTETELLKLTGLSKTQLADCRTKKKLPFLKISQNCRLYLERDVVEWMKSCRKILNGGANAPD